MSAIQQLLTDHIDIWTAAETEKKSGRGRASGSAASVYGIKKLRELILELAVRGKLVPQDASEEPASELLKRIQIERSKLVAEEQIKKEKSFDPISSEEIPFQLPHEWKWVRIGQIGHDWGQKIPDCDFTYIEVSAIDNQRGVISSAELVRPENAPSRARKLVRNGTLIYSTIRPYLLNIAVVEEDFLPEPIASTAFAVVHPFCAMPPRYFLFFLRSPVFVQYVESVQMGIAYPAINDRQFFSGMIPLPPIEEQHRIVAKVDELMALCDQLQAQHGDAADAHEKLVSHLLGTLTQSQSAADFNTNWQRIAAHFDTLFTTEASIDALKQTLLQLAVMGKLVAQDANEEPASELLKRIEAEKAKLVSEGTIKKDKSPSTITEEEKPFILSEGWKWVRFNDVIDPSYPISYGVLVPGSDEKDGIPFVRIADLDINSPPEKPEKSISREVDSQYERTRLEGGEILMGVVGSIGKLGVAPDTWKGANIARAICRIKVNEFISKKYVILLLQSQFMQRNFLGDTKTLAQPTLNIGLIRLSLTPLPPVPEQLRIVGKVDELMVLCDQVKSRITAANQQQKKLADVLVEHAIGG